MRTVRFAPEYGAYPLWLMDESDRLIGPQPPEELGTHPDILANLDRIEDIYNSLFIDAEHEFRWKGFDTEDEKAEYIALVGVTLTRLKEVLGKEYRIVDHTYLDRL